MNVSEWRGFYFDFDGVIADSVEVKTRAFALLFKPFGSDIVEMVVDHHRAHGGMTRVDKIKHYYEEFLCQPLNDIKLKELCENFSHLVKEEVITAPEIAGVSEFLMEWQAILPCFLISATPEEEMREIVERRGISCYFKDVRGAPRGKKENLDSLLNQYRLLPSRCIFFGDAETDYQAARACGVRFLGILPGPDAPLLKSVPGIKWAKDFREIRSQESLRKLILDENF